MQNDEDQKKRNLTVPSTKLLSDSFDESKSFFYL